MIELFDKLEHLTIDDLKHKKSVLLDTCFFVYMLERDNQKRVLDMCKDFDVALTSFNVAEFDHIKHKIDESVREKARRFLKKSPDISVVDIPVFPGNRKAEEAYVRTVDEKILDDVDDPSDAVLIACAIQTDSHVLTRDKHHLFTAKLDNYIQKYNISVYNHIPELMKNEN
ncbi:MAG: type II toxin-antitoxin system VapC family toxin [Nanoarchaeota archaeon]|nr:type II toxin-antitoxin system VapC family toxin [Nanoarchaeota archaeon]